MSGAITIRAITADPLEQWEVTSASYAGADRVYRNLAAVMYRPLYRVVVIPHLLREETAKARQAIARHKNLLACYPYGAPTPHRRPLPLVGDV